MMSRASSKPASVSKPRRGPSPSRMPSPSPATAPKAKAKNVGGQRRRSPLSDLNSGDASAARPGCFRFLMSSGSGSRSRCASAPRTTPAVDSKPRSEIRRRGVGGGRVPEQESRTRVEQLPRVEKRGGREGSGCGQIRRVEPAKKQGPARGPHQQQKLHLEALTPQRKADAGATPASGATPPIHASISPEVLACGSATPACFAAGHHVVPGVGDRRKCRPKGILAIAGEGASEELDADPSRASIQWLSSPSGEAGKCSSKCGNEALVNWLASPHEGVGVDLLGDEIFVPRCSLEDAFWQFSPECTGLLSSPVLGGQLEFGTPVSELSETTPSLGFLPAQKTPSTGDSISPFSLIVKRASQSLSSRGLKSLCSQQGQDSCSYGSSANPTPISGDPWNNKCSGLTRTSRVLTRMDPVVECVEMMTLSPRPGDADYRENGALSAPLPELSFQFVGAPTPLESIDLSTFKRSPCGIEFKGKSASFQKPVLEETRISWREGLVSRMFDMGDLDCCKWWSDDEDGPVIQGNEDSLHHSGFQPASPSCRQQGGDQTAPCPCGFGSVEFNCSGSEMNTDSKPPPNPVSVAESMRAEGFELVSSDDSDWTLFYKNGLFET
ncbi:hypothetical protein ABZP36_008935 [Zizania latifolia]